MRKIMISQDKLDSFSLILKDIAYSIHVSLSGLNEKKSKKIRSLLEQLINSWNQLYDPTDLFYSKSIRNVYGLYIEAKKNNEINQAEKYLDLYKILKIEREKNASGILEGGKKDEQ